MLNLYEPNKQTIVIDTNFKEAPEIAMAKSKPFHILNAIKKDRRPSLQIRPSMKYKPNPEASENDCDQII